MRGWTWSAVVAMTALALSPELCWPQAAARAAGPTGEVAGRVVRPDGLPQPDAEVVLAQRTLAGTLRQLKWRARTAFDGRYVIAAVPPGRYQVLVRPIGADVGAAGRPGATLFPGVPASEAGSPIDVLAGLATEGIDVWLVPSPRRFMIIGRVFGPDGTTFDSLVVEVGRPAARATDVWNSDEAGGLFTIDAAPPGTLILRARVTNGDQVLTGLAATTVATNPVEDVRITVRPQVEISGRVATGSKRALPPGLSIALVPQALEPSVLYPASTAPVGADGSFRAVADDAPARIVVHGLPAGWRAARPDGSLTLDVPSSDEPLDLVIGPASR